MAFWNFCRPKSFLFFSRSLLLENLLEFNHVCVITSLFVYCCVNYIVFLVEIFLQLDMENGGQFLAQCQCALDPS